MPRTLTLHIGTPKSGTTHLQSILHAGRRELARAGVRYPGEAYLPQKGFNQQPAVYALAGASVGWIDDDVRANAGRHLDRLAVELSECPGRALVSAEALSFFDEAAARRLLDRLGYDPAAVTVVITARDLGRLLPSIWQQNVKNGSPQALEPYLESVAAQRDRTDIPLWTAFGLPGLVRRWSAVVGLARVVLVTAPHPGGRADELWRRYATAANLPVTLFEGAPSRGLATDNLSLSPSQTELVRRLNLVLAEEGYSRARQQVVRGRLLGVWMNHHGTGGARLAVPEHLRDDVRRWAREDAAYLAECRVRIVGDLGDLAPRFAPTAAEEPMAVGTATARDVLTLVEEGLLGRPAVPAQRSWRGRFARLTGRAGVNAQVPAPPEVDLSERDVDVRDRALRGDPQEGRARPTGYNGLSS